MSLVKMRPFEERTGLTLFILCVVEFIFQSITVNFILRVDLGEKYTKSCNAQIAESDQMGWYGVVPSSDTLWYSSWTLGAPGAELGHF